MFLYLLVSLLHELTTLGVWAAPVVLTPASAMDAARVRRPTPHGSPVPPCLTAIAAGRLVDRRRLSPSSRRWAFFLARLPDLRRPFRRRGWRHRSRQKREEPHIRKGIQETGGCAMCHPANEFPQSSHGQAFPPSARTDAWSPRPASARGSATRTA